MPYGPHSPSPSKELKRTFSRWLGETLKLVGVDVNIFKSQY